MSYESQYQTETTRARECIRHGEYDEAQVHATLAVADRLDRLCEILSARR